MRTVRAVISAVDGIFRRTSASHEPETIARTEERPLALIEQCQAVWEAVRSAKVANLGQWPGETLRRVEIILTELEGYTSDFDSTALVGGIRQLINELGNWCEINLPEIVLPKQVFEFIELEEKRKILNGKIAALEEDIRIFKIQPPCPKHQVVHPLPAWKKNIIATKNTELSKIREELARTDEECLKYQGVSRENIVEWVEFAKEWNARRSRTANQLRDCETTASRLRYKLGNLAGQGNEGKQSLKERVKKARLALSEYMKTQEHAITDISKFRAIAEKHGKEMLSEQNAIDSSKIPAILHDIETTFGEIVASMSRPPEPTPAEVVGIPVIGITETSVRLIEKRATEVIPDDATVISIDVLEETRKRAQEEARARRYARTVLILKAEIGEYEKAASYLMNIKESAESENLERYIENAFRIIEIKKQICDGFSSELVESIKALTGSLGNERIPADMEDAIRIMRRLEIELKLPRANRIFRRLTFIEGLGTADKVLIRWQQALMETAMRRNLETLRIPQERMDVTANGQVTSQPFGRFYLNSLSRVMRINRRLLVRTFESKTAGRYLAAHTRKHVGDNGYATTRGNGLQYGVSRYAMTLDEERKLWRVMSIDPSSRIFQDRIERDYGNRITENAKWAVDEADNMADTTLYGGATIMGIQNGEPFLRLHFLQREREYRAELIFLFPLNGEYLLCTIFGLDSLRWESTFITKWGIISNREKSRFFAPIADSLIQR